jgi:multidrug efflux pump subunit AcrB
LSREGVNLNYKMEGFKDMKTTFVGLAMRRPISVCVLVTALALAAFLALKKMPRDILPNLGIPIIYVAQPYGGLDPGQMKVI